MKTNVIAVFGVPRTGTSWLGEIFDSSPEVVYKYQPLFSYSFKDRVTVRSTREDINEFFDELQKREDPFLDQTMMREKGSYPVFNKKKDIEPTLVFKEVRYLYLIPHLLSVMENLKVVMISRDVLETMNSWINAPSEYREEWDINREWYYAQSKNEFMPENYYGYAKWKEAQYLFAQMLNQYPEKTIMVNYRDLYSEASKQVRKLFQFCGLEYTSQTADFLEKSQGKTVNDAYGVYRKKGEQRIYKKQLPHNIADWIMQDIHLMKSYGFIK